MSQLDEAFTNLVLGIFRANGAFVEWGDAFSAPHNLTSARWQMMGALALSDEPLSSPRVAEAMGVSRQGAQKQLNLLLEDGSIERLANPANARSPLYRLTRKGHSRYREIEANWRRHVNDKMKHLNAKELDRAADLVKHITALFAMPSTQDA